MKVDDYQLFKFTPEQRKGRVEKFLKALKETADADIWKLPFGLFMDYCAKCGTCAELCQIYQTDDKEAYHPAKKVQMLRSVYKRYFTLSGKIFGKLVGAEDLTEDKIDEIAEASYRCSLCRRCGTNCPIGIDNMMIIRSMRTILSEALGIEPKILTDSVKAHLETGNVSSVPEEAFKNFVQFFEGEAKESAGIDIKVPLDKKGADYLIVPPMIDFLENADTIIGYIKTFHAAGVDWTFSSRRTLNDSVNFGAFYNNQKLVEIGKMGIEEAANLGAKTVVIAECGHALKAWKILYPAIFGKQPFEVKSILEVTADFIKKGKITVDPNKNPEPTTYHDPCNVGRMSGILEEPRVIMKAVCKDFREMDPNRDMNWCCGGGGALVIIDQLKDFKMNITGKYKVDQIKASGAKVVAAPCANCKKQIRELIDHYKLDTTLVGVHDLVGNAIVF